MKLPKDLHSMTAQDWAAYGAAKRRAMPAPRVNTSQPKLSNKPHPSLLQAPPPLSDAQWAARAAGVMARQKMDAELEAMFDSDPTYWNSPDDS